MTTMTDINLSWLDNVEQQTFLKGKRDTLQGLMTLKFGNITPDFIQKMFDDSTFIA